DCRGLEEGVLVRALRLQRVPSGDAGRLDRGVPRLRQAARGRAGAAGRPAMNAARVLPCALVPGPTRRGLSHPVVAGALLLSRLLGVGRGDLRVRAGERFSPELAARLEQQLARRLAGEPVQYITGRAAFRSLDLAVDHRVLVPRPETEWLVEAVLEYLASA